MRCRVRLSDVDGNKLYFTFKSTEEREQFEKAHQPKINQQNLLYKLRMRKLFPEFILTFDEVNNPVRTSCPKGTSSIGFIPESEDERKTLQILSGMLESRPHLEYKIEFETEGLTTTLTFFAINDPTF